MKAAIYRSLKPVYSNESLLDYVEFCVADINYRHLMAQIFAGDVNQLQELAVKERTGLVHTVQLPTRSAVILNRVFISGQSMTQFAR